MYIYRLQLRIQILIQDADTPSWHTSEWTMCCTRRGHRRTRFSCSLYTARRWSRTSVPPGPASPGRAGMSIAAQTIPSRPCMHKFSVPRPPGASSRVQFYLALPNPRPRAAVVGRSHDHHGQRVLPCVLTERSRVPSCLRLAPRGDAPRRTQHGHDLAELVLGLPQPLFV